MYISSHALQTWGHSFSLAQSFGHYILDQLQELPTDQFNKVCNNRKGLDLKRLPIYQRVSKKKKNGTKTFFCTRICARQTYPIQEAADPEDHFPPEHQKAEGKRERETEQIQLGHPSAALLPVCSF